MKRRHRSGQVHADVIGKPYRGERVDAGAIRKLYRGNRVDAEARETQTSRRSSTRRYNWKAVSRQSSRQRREGNAAIETIKYAQMQLECRNSRKTEPAQQPHVADAAARRQDRADFESQKQSEAHLDLSRRRS